MFYMPTVISTEGLALKQAAEHIRFFTYALRAVSATNMKKDLSRAQGFQTVEERNVCIGNLYYCLSGTSLEAMP